MDRMKNNWPVKLVSLIFAIALWFYVVLEKNPFITMNINDIEVKIKNEEYLKDRKIKIVNPVDPVVNVKISGTRKNVNKVTRSDIIVTADVRGINKDTATIKLNYSVPEEVTLEKVSDDEMKFTFDKVETIEKEVEISKTGKLPSENLVELKTEITPEKIEISGESKELQKIDKVQALLDLSLITDSRTVNSKIEVFDKNGDKMDNIILSKTEASISVDVASNKRVPIKVVTKNEPEGFKESNIQLNKENITILGDEKTLKKVEAIETEPVDLKNVTNNATLKTRLILPDGVSLMNEENIEVKLVMSDDSNGGESSQAHIIKLDELKIRDDELNRKITFLSEDKEINVMLYGDKEKLENIKSENLKLSIDISDLNSGKHEVQIKSDNIDGVSNIKINPDKITIQID